MNDTVFGKIIRGEIPATKVYEDERCYSILDINPVSKGHTLIFPKEHYVWMQDVPDELLSYIFATAKRIMISMKETLGCDYVQVVIEGKSVPHFHIHLIPAWFTIPIVHWEYTAYADGEAQEYAKKIASTLQ